MNITSNSLDLHALDSAGAAALESGAQDGGRPQPFGDFSAFAGAARVGTGQLTASADPAHAARTVVAHLLTD